MYCHTILLLERIGLNCIMLSANTLDYHLRLNYQSYQTILYVLMD
jgi:hypothetical protein